jgi:hypothetical protein
VFTEDQAASESPTGSRSRPAVRLLRIVAEQAVGLIEHVGGGSESRAVLAMCAGNPGCTAVNGLAAWLRGRI